ncbi:DUF1801 domain-containing protein [Polyangium aurulentum]|uniref:DUF1801 domain-containing protein n=1 Tax=Polyangium aurulentum TaxID=2567896 RepID=UPI0010AEBE27|nr:DUF1801 domain-containing protein [Polyangium aurulentum]UQA59373.1 DUF1801 domain-containing protein [Polyangium aurulentum]
MKTASSKPSKPQAKTKTKTKTDSPAKPAPRAAAAKRAASPKASGAGAGEDVAAFMRDLDHPLKAEIEGLRQIILGVDPEVREEIKWNAPSFRTTEHFATFNLRTKDSVRIILHTGAKVKESATKGLKIADPAGLLEWLSKDRCLVTFSDGKDIQGKRAALEAILREWIRSAL